ncbi:MAG: hypothetical protein NC121_18780, partial [Blautia sp.]|nr:hypothetical protein [Blautia sp.]
SDSLTGVLNALEEFEGLDTFSEKMDDAVKALDRLDWKVSIGLELTEGEAEEYQKAIEDFVSNAQEYALQARYSVSLSMDLSFSEDDLERSNLVAKVDQFYADKYQELAALGADLRDAVTDAFNDGLLEPDEITTIARIQKDMAEIEKSLAVGDFQATLAMLEMDYSGKELTPETVLELMGELDENGEAAIEAYRKQYAKNYSAITASYDGGALTEDEYHALLQDAEDDLAMGTADTLMRNMQFLQNTINSTYGDEIGQYQEAVEQALEKWSDPTYDWDWENTPWAMIGGVMEDIAGSGPDEASKKAVAELLAPMEGSIDEMNLLMDQLGDSMSPEMRQEMAGMIAYFDQVKAMTVYRGALGYGGDTEGLVNDILNRAGGPGNDTAISEAANRYLDTLSGDLAGHTATAVEASLEAAKTETVGPVIDGMYAYSQEYLDQVFAGGLHATTEFGLEVHPSYVGSNGTGIMSNAAGGIYSRPILTTFAEEGPEAAVPLDGSERAKSIWARAGQILGTLPQGNRDQALLAGMSAGMQEGRTGGSIQVSYHPTVTIQGSASKDDVHGALALTLEDLREMLVEIQRVDGMVSFV